MGAEAAIDAAPAITVARVTCAIILLMSILLVALTRHLFLTRFTLMRTPRSSHLFRIRSLSTSFGENSLLGGENEGAYAAQVMITGVVETIRRLMTVSALRSRGRGQSVHWLQCKPIAIKRSAHRCLLTRSRACRGSFQSGRSAQRLPERHMHQARTTSATRQRPPTSHTSYRSW